MKRYILLVLLLIVQSACAMMRMIRPVAQRFQLSRYTAQFRLPAPQITHTTRSVVNTRSTSRTYHHSFPQWKAAAAAAGITGFLLSAQHAQAQEEQQSTAVPAKPWAAVESRYRKMFEEEEKKLIDEFFEIFRPLIPNTAEFEKFRQLMLQKPNAYKKIDQKSIRTILTKYPEQPSQDLKNKITRCLQRHGISDQSKIIVRKASDPTQCTGFAGNISSPQAILIVNEKQLTTDAKTFEFIMLHEITHYKKPSIWFANQLDFLQFMRSCFNGFLFPSSDPIKSLNKWKQKYSQFKEREADIEAGLREPKYALAGAKYFAHQSELHEIDPFSLQNKRSRELFKDSLFSWHNYMHPADDERAAYLNKLYQEMLATIPTHEIRKYT